MAKEEKEYSKKETQERFDAMLKGALKSPPKPLKSIKTDAKKRSAAKGKRSLKT